MPEVTTGQNWTLLALVAAVVIGGGGFMKLLLNQLLANMKELAGAIKENTFATTTLAKAVVDQDANARERHAQTREWMLLQLQETRHMIAGKVGEALMKVGLETKQQFEVVCGMLADARDKVLDAIEHRRVDHDGRLG